jgi:hypothetical protein
MNVSPRLAAAAASTRTHEDVLRARPQFGSIARVKFDERELFTRVQKAITELEMALGSAAEFSDAMPANYSALLDAFNGAVHDECVTPDALEGAMENMQ